MKTLFRAIAHPREYEWLALRPWRRHSLVLLFAGVVYILFGVSCFTTTDIPEPDRLMYELVLNLAPIPVWGALWFGTGLLGILSSRWPPASETWGYSALSGMATLWGSLVIASTFLGASSQALFNGLVFYLLAFVWWAISGLVNPAEKVRDAPS